MSESKTKPTVVDPVAFIEAIEHPVRRAEAYQLLAMHREVTGEDPVMWGPSIIGFGSYHYTYESGREGDAPAAGFSPRKAQCVVYLIGGYEDIYQEQLSRLGRYKTGSSCLYLPKLDAIDEAVLREMVADSFRRMRDVFPR